MNIIWIFISPLCGCGIGELTEPKPNNTFWLVLPVHRKLTRFTVEKRVLHNLFFRKKRGQFYCGKVCGWICLNTPGLRLLSITCPNSEHVSTHCNMHTEKSFWNFIKSNQNQIIFTIFRLIWIQTDVRLVPNQSRSGKYNLISGRFNNISKIFLCVCIPKTWQIYSSFMNEFPLNILSLAWRFFYACDILCIF